MIIEVSMIIITVCLVALIVVALILGINLQKSLKNIDQAIKSVEFKLDNALDEVSTTLCQATTTLNSINELTISVKNKIDATDPLFDSIAKVGHVMQSFLGTFPAREVKIPKIFNFSQEKEKFDIAQLAEWVGLGVILWQKLKKRI